MTRAGSAQRAQIGRGGWAFAQVYAPGMSGPASASCPADGAARGAGLGHPAPVIAPDLGLRQLLRTATRMGHPDLTLPDTLSNL